MGTFKKEKLETYYFLKKFKTMQRNKQATRRAEFKKKLTANDIRQRRDSATQLLRKNKREESLMKRRFARSSDGAEDAKTTQQDIAVLNNDADSQKLVNDLQSSEFAVVLSATTQIRRMLSIERDPPIDRVLQMGVLPRLVSFLQCWDTQPQLALEAAWAITNVASGTSAHTRAVVEAGAVPMFVQLLGCAAESLRDQCVWALGNIAGDGSELRDMCLEQNVMQALLYQFTQDPSEGILRNTTWAVSNLCRGKPAPEFEKVRMCIPALTQLLHHQDKDTTVDAAWALSYLTDGDDNKIQAVVEAGVCARLVEMLSSDDKTIQTPSLRAVGNIVTGTASQTQAIVDTNPFASLAQLLHSSKRSIVKEACWTLSNITAGEQGQIQTVIDAGLMSSLADKLSVGEFDVQKEACWAISNATTGGTPEQIRSFVEEKTIKGLISIAGKQDAKIANVALEALENILNAGEIDGVDNIYLDWFEEHEGVDLLEDLQDHQNDALYNRAVDMTEKFFDGEEDEANAENIAPNVVTHNNQSTFAFGLSGNANNQQTASTGFAF